MFLPWVSDVACVGINCSSAIVGYNHTYSLKINHVREGYQVEITGSFGNFYQSRGSGNLVMKLNFQTQKGKNCLSGSGFSVIYLENFPYKYQNLQQTPNPAAQLPSAEPPLVVHSEEV